MSEEILKALMQLFAIITKQDEGVSIKERQYIELFLKQQLNAEAVPEYIRLYESFLGTDSAEASTEEEVKKKKLTSVKDSVKTLSICKKINKTLTQKQKIVVLVRLFELIDSEISDQNTNLNQRKEIINTVSTVFNIDGQEFVNIEQFAQSKTLLDMFENPEVLLVSSKLQSHAGGAKVIPSDLEGTLGILHISSEDMYFLKYIGSSNLLLNGLPINARQINLFAYGSTIKLPHGDPIYYSDINSYFLSGLDIAKISFEVEKISYRFPNGAIGLQEVSLAEGPGKLIAIMGGSGAGKTTLLNVMAGLEKVSSGHIKINGLDLYKNKKQLEGVIGYVAQDDILFEELTVYQNLLYNAKLCFGNFNQEQLDEAVFKTLKSLGLYEIRDIKVGNVLNKKISGGQRKRLNIALELIREPAVLFLDEPTSGLSSRDSENVLDLLKELTLKGKLIFVVIHQPSSDIYKMFDKVVILDTGGYQIYYGNPVNAVVYFKQLTNQINAEEGQCPHCGNVNPEQIFNTIDAKVVDEYGNLTDKRKNSPKTWEEYFRKFHKFETVEQISELPPKTLKLPNRIKQIVVFIIRDVLSKIGNTQYMVINLLEAPILAFVLSFIIRYIDDPKAGQYYYGNNENIPAYLFMAAIVALFMGLTISAEEIIKDAKILKRESFLNLSRFSYLFSKIAILFTISALQMYVFALIGNYILGIKDMNFAYWVILFSLSCLANVLGLNISSSFNSAVTIYILIPLLLIPQMILSGAIFSFDKLNKYISSKDKVPVLADLMASRWAFEALAVHQFKENKFEKAFYSLDQAESKADFKSVYWAPKLISKIDETLDLIYKSPESYQIYDNFELIKSEIIAELVQNKSVSLDLTDLKGNMAEPKESSLRYLRNVAVLMGDFHSAAYVAANTTKDDIVSRFKADSAKAALYALTKKQYYNESLADLVKNESSKSKIMEYRGRLLQIKDPIFLEPAPDSSLWGYRSHLYAPVKYFFGKKIDTFWFNVMVLWFITAFLFVTLYFNAFRKFLEFFSKMQRFASQKGK